MNPYIFNVPIIRRHQAADAEKNISLETAAMMKEISWSESDLYRAFYAYGQNPDIIVRNKGLKIYSEMMEDDQIKACIELRKEARLSTPWQILSAEEGNLEADKRADFIKHVLKRMKGTFEDDLYEIFSAIEFGFSVSELIYEIMEDGPFAGKMGLRAIKTREPFNYDFKTDEHGNLLGIVYTGIAPVDSHVLSGKPIIPSGNSTWPRTSNLGANYSGSLENPFPPEKFIIYSYNSQFGNFYGRSDLFSAFRSWGIKKHIMKFWSIWLERYASPFIWASVKEGSQLKKQVLDEIDGFLRLVGTRNAIRVPDSITLNPIQFSTAGGDSYEKAIEAHNRFIAHAILCPNLLGYTQQLSGGSYALGKKHFDAFVWVLEKMGRDVSETIVGEQIIKRLIALNFPDSSNELMPIFKFEGIEEDSIESRARIVTMLSNAGFVNPEEIWIRDFLTLPNRDPGIELPRPLPRTPGFMPFPNDDDDAEARISMKNKSMSLTDKNEIRREPDRFEKKMRVSEFERNLDSGEKVLLRDLTENLNGVRDSIISQAEKKQMIESGDPKIVENLHLNIGDFKNTLRMWLVKFHLDAKLGAFEELGRAGVSVEVTKNFAEIKAPFEPWAPLPPTEAVDFFNRKVKAKIVDKSGRKVLVEIASGKELKYYDEKAFSIAGIVRDDILNGAKQVILNGIKRQDRVGAMEDLKDLFNKYVAGGIALDDELLEPHRLQTIVRTNMTDAINQGRAAMYMDEDVKGFIEFWQYVGILDSRQTDYCKCMSGKIFRIDRLLELQPSAHFNCRSFTVPITQFEIDDLKTEGKGIEISKPCPDRMAGFAENRKDFLIGYDPLKLMPDMRGQIEKGKYSCPYSSCASSDVVKTERKYNRTDYLCNACHLPFRITDSGDLYLFDSGEEKWMRATRGMNPSYFMVENHA